MKTLFRMNKSEFLSAPIGQLVKETGIRATTLSRWINGDVSPTMEKLEEMAEKLDMDRVEFLEAFLERRDATIKRRSQLDS